MAISTTHQTGGPDGMLRGKAMRDGRETIEKKKDKEKGMGRIEGKKSFL